MLKKLSICLSCLLLFACQSATQEEKKETKQPQSNTTELRFVHMFQGDGNEQGFYHVATRNIGNESCKNIYYFDYASKKEIFLCDKPECKHDDASCSSYLDPYSLDKFLFVSGSHIYFIQNDSYAFSLDNKDKAGGTTITQIDLDGKNHKILARLPEGFTFTSNNMICNEQYAYLNLEKDEDKEMANGNYMRITMEKKLYRVDLTNGEVKEITDFRGMDMIGVDGTNIILSKAIYPKDPDEYIKQGDFEGYDQMMISAKNVYSTYDTSKNTFGKEWDIDSQEYCTYSQGYLYYMNQNTLHRVSMKDGKNEKVAQLNSQNSYTISSIWDDVIYIGGWQEGNTTQSITYAYHMDTKEVKEFTLYTNKPRIPVEIYAETKDQYFVYYDHDQHIEKTWAGTDQYTLDQAYYGLINKQDYWNNQSNYETFKTVYHQDGWS